MPDRRPTCLSEDHQTMDMFDINHQLSDGSPIRHIIIGIRSWVSDQAYRYSMGLRSGMSAFDLASLGLRWVSDHACWSPMKHVEVFDGSLIRHVGLRCSMSRSSMGLRSGLSVSNEACLGLQWVSDQACQSLMQHVKGSDGSPMKHVEVSDQTCWSPIIVIFSLTPIFVYCVLEDFFMFSILILINPYIDIFL